MGWDNLGWDRCHPVPNIFFMGWEGTGTQIEKKLGWDGTRPIPFTSLKI